MRPPQDGDCLIQVATYMLFSSRRQPVAADSGTLSITAVDGRRSRKQYGCTSQLGLFIPQVLEEEIDVSPDAADGKTVDTSDQPTQQAVHQKDARAVHRQGIHQKQYGP